MTTIRRTLSPVPRPGISLGGEAISVASPLSKCSSCNQDYTHTPTSGSISSSSSYFASSEYALYRFQSFFLNLFSRRTSRSLEKQKPKANNVWRKSLFHFFICFLIGVFLGFTPIVSLKVSTNLVSRNQAFSFEQVGRKVQLYDDVNTEKTSSNVTKVVETLTNNLVNVSETKTLTLTLSNDDDKVVGGKFLIIVTPTYPRMFQGYYLNRLAHTLKLVEPPLLWIVVEMSSQSGETSELLRKSGVMYRHLVCTKNTTTIKDARVHQRNVALSHIEKHRLDGIVYFADDTNIYSTELFDHMRHIKRFGTWLVAKVKTSTRFAAFVGPICNGTQVIGWHTNNVMRRYHRFHAELPGFAFNSTILWDPKRWHRPTLEPIRQLDDAFQVSTLIEQVVEDETDMEGIPKNCSKVLVWHLPMESSSSSSHPQQWSFNTNLNAILPLSQSI